MIEMANPVGRPTEYNEEYAAKILDRISTTTIGMKKICADFDIDVTTVWRWIAKHEAFRHQYDIAKELQSRLIADELKEVSDDRSLDILDDGRINGVAVQRDKLRMDSRKYLIELLKPYKKEEDKEAAALDKKLSDAMDRVVKSKERDY